MKVLKALLRGLDYVEETLIVVLLAFMSIMNFLNVLFRYCFSSSFSFTEELTVMAFVWVTMLGVATGYKRCAHLGMSFIVDQFPKKGQALFMVFSTVCSVAMIALLIKYGIDMVAGQIMLGAKTPALRLPAAMQGLSIPVGGAFMLIRTLEAGIRETVKLWKGGDEA